MKKLQILSTMSHIWPDNVFEQNAFTPREYQVELLAAAIEQNVLICLGHNSSKEFIVLKLLQELAPSLRKKKTRKIVIYITYQSTGESIYNLIYHLTDFKVFNYYSFIDINDIDEEVELAFNQGCQIFIFDVKTCRIFLSHKFIPSENIIFIIEDCHETTQQENIVNFVFSSIDANKKPKVLGLAGPLHNAECPPQELKATLKVFEENIFCRAETASDIVTVLRYEFLFP